MELVDASSVGGSPGELSLDELGERIVGMSGRLAAATCRWLVLVAEFDAREGYLSFGLVSSAQWLTHACGVAHRTAVDQVRVARSLLQYPRLAEEMGAGRLSYSQVRALSRIAEPGERPLVDDLIEAARHATVAQLEVLVSGLRTVDHNENATDALLRLAQIGLAALGDADNPPRDLRGDERAAVVIHVDAARVPARSAERGADDPIVARPYARIAGGPGLPDRVLQRLICDGRIRTVIHDGASNVLDVGRTHRLVTDRQYRALLARQHRHCAHPGCPNLKNLHAHHRIHWIHGGRTDLDNLLLLCERHHLAHHGGQFHIHTAGAGRFRFVSSNGRDLRAPLRGPTSPHTRPLEDEHTDVAPDAATPRWDGQRLDRPYAISVLAQRRQDAS